MDLTELKREHANLLQLQSDYTTECKDVSLYLLPGRGLYDITTKPTKRKLTSSKIINTTGDDALQVLTSGIHGGMTSQARPWFLLGFADLRLLKHLMLKKWLEDCQKSLYAAFRQSNFYEVIHSFYTEYAGFGTSGLYFGEDGSPFRFELMTVGEYAFSHNFQGKVDKLYRVLFPTYRQMVKEFGIENVADRIKVSYERDGEQSTVVVHAVVPETFQDKPFTSYYYEVGSADKILRKKGFYEFPFIVGRWDLVGSDVYGLGPGSKALPDIKRLQEMDKAFLMAAHKSINPPVNAPVRKQGQVQLLPGGVNYYSNPNEKVTNVYDIRFDYAGVTAAIEKTESKIKTKFFNDIFISSSRDPNLSPLKAAEVEKRYGEEKVFRIGPVMERLQSEVLGPMIERGFNILARKDLLPPLDPSLMQLVEQTGGLQVRYVSPLSQSQKYFLISPLNNFLGAVGGLMQMDPTVKDNIDLDKIVEEYADVTGAPAAVLNTPDRVKEIRDERQKQIANAQKQQAQMAQQAMLMEQQKGQAEVAKTYSDAGVNLNEVINESL